MKALKIILLAMAVFAAATSARAKSIEGVEEEEVKNIEDSNVATTGGEGEDDYSCFPFIFNPGCYFNTWVNWKWVCKSNTMGWEQCDLMKPEEIIEEEEDIITEKEAEVVDEKKEEEKKD